jgi:hypothetical protein
MIDDKHWVIVCATIIGIMSFFFPETAIAQNVVTGLFGVAVGKAIS